MMVMVKLRELMNRKEIGETGERIAEGYLKRKGYKILDKNYFFRIPGSPQRGEIDIVAKKEDIIHFIEVKALRNSIVGIRPEDKVNRKKQRKIIRSAESWLIKRKLPLNSKWQIDVITLQIKNKNIKILHFENAIPYY